MQFHLVDRVTEWEAGRRAAAIKALSLSEEYLMDHFPTFPVMPGVLMLETLVQSAAWLVRATQNFAFSTILLEEAKNVTYKSFVAPGSVLRAEVNVRSLNDDRSEFSGLGWCGDKEVVRARFSLRHFNLRDRMENAEELDNKLIAVQRETWARLIRKH